MKALEEVLIAEERRICNGHDMLHIGRDLAEDLRTTPDISE